MNVVKLKENVKDFLGIINDECPICKEKFVHVEPMVIDPISHDSKIGYHLRCYEEFKGLK